MISNATYEPWIPPLVEDLYQLSRTFDEKYVYLWRDNRELYSMMMSDPQAPVITGHTSIFWSMMHDTVTGDDPLGSFIQDYDSLISGVGVLVTINAGLISYLGKHDVPLETTQTVTMPEDELEAAFNRLQFEITQLMVMVAAHAKALTDEYVIVAEYGTPLRDELEATQAAHFTGVLNARDAYFVVQSGEGLQRYIQAVLDLGSSPHPLTPWSSQKEAVKHRPESRVHAEQLFNRLLSQELLGDLVVLR